MEFEFHVGDLLASGEEVIAHGCNCLGFMGAGIAGQIAKAYPTVYYDYREQVGRHNFRIGSCLPVVVHDARLGERTVFNLGTQWYTGADATYWGVSLSFSNMAEYCSEFTIERVAIPRIGCGIGGLKWDSVQQAIDAFVSSSTIPELTIAVYDFEAP